MYGRLPNLACSLQLFALSLTKVSILKTMTLGETLVSPLFVCLFVSFDRALHERFHVDSLLFPFSCRGPVGNATCECDVGFTGNGTYCEGRTVWCYLETVYMEKKLSWIPPFWFWGATGLAHVLCVPSCPW